MGSCGSPFPFQNGVNFDVFKISENLFLKDLLIAYVRDSIKLGPSSFKTLFEIPFIPEEFIFLKLLTALITSFFVTSLSFK